MEANYEIDSKDEPSLYEDYIAIQDELKEIWENDLTILQRNEVEDFIDSWVDE